MRIAVTGATGLIGRQLVAALLARGDQVTVLSRSRAHIGDLGDVAVTEWDSSGGPAPDLSGLDGVVHLAGEPVAQRWTSDAKARIRSSRVDRTQALVAALRGAEPRPGVLVSTSAAGYYGDRGSALLDETASPGPPDDFLASVCVEWERAASAAHELGIRVLIVRNGVVLDRNGGALSKMLTPFKAGVGGPIAGGQQYLSWIAIDDVVAIYLAALDGSESWTGPVNASAPSAVTNATFSSALGRALHRPAFIPLPGFVPRLLFGEMASVLTASQRMVPAKLAELGYEFRYPDLDRTLEAVLAR